MRTIVTTLRSNDHVSVITAPIRNGQSQAGVEWGADFLLRFTHLNQKFQMVPLPHRRRPEDGKKLYEKIYQQVLGEMTGGRFALTLGGDHSLSIASLAAALRVYPDLRILWLDAHADINTPITSPTGNLHGMPVAALLGLFDLSYHREFAWLKPCLQSKHLAYLGVRDLDSGEKEILSRLNIAVYTAQDIRQQGMKRIFSEIQRRLGIESDTPVYTSLDMDGLDPEDAPATGLCVPHGIRITEFLDLIELVKVQTQWVGSDLVEFNPFVAKSQMAMLKTLSTAEAFFRFLPWKKKIGENSGPSHHETTSGSTNIIHLDQRQSRLGSCGQTKFNAYMA